MYFRFVCRLIISYILGLLLIFNKLEATILLNSSYDVSRELFSAINAAFIEDWHNLHPKDTLIIRQSHAGSSRQAMAVLQGFNADVVTYNQVPDIQILCDKGKLISSDWRNRLPNHSSPFYSTIAFLVRKGNSKDIYNWDDLVRDDVKIVCSNPKTSGSGRYAYLAAWSAILQKNDGDEVKTRVWMSKFLNNVIVFDTGGRSATVTFVERGQGDVLINFESELSMIRDKYNEYDIVVPEMNILAEFPVAWIDKNIDKNGTREIAIAYLKFLYTDRAREIITSFNYRVYDMKKLYNLQDKFPTVNLLKIEDYFGSWDKVMNTHFCNGGELDKLLHFGQ